MIAFLLANGYRDIRAVNGVLCAVHRFNFTTGLVVGLSLDGYRLRYCYEHAEDARAALLAWDGADHPPGSWIKCKGAGIDLLNPAFGRTGG